MAEEPPGLQSLDAPVLGIARLATRDAIAAYVLEHRDRIRLVARKLTAVTRRVFDSGGALLGPALDGMAARSLKPGRGRLRP